MTSTSQVVKRQGRDLPTSTATALLSPTIAPHCSYCQQSHFSGECGVVTAPDERNQILKRSGRCFICLKKYHVSKDCWSTNRRRKCGGRHHPSICPKISTRVQNATTGHTETHPPTPQVPNPPNALRQTEHNPQTTTFAPVTSTNLCSDNTKVVLLRIMRTRVYSPTNPQLTGEVRVLMDSGCQRSYITDS